MTEHSHEAASAAPIEDRGCPEQELRRALRSRPRTVPPRWLYDDFGLTLVRRLP